MPRTHHTSKGEDLARGLDVPPQDERLLADIRKTADSVARFYGFESMEISPIESTGVFAPLVRAGLLDERPPVACEMKNGDAMMLAPSGVLGMLRAYGAHRMQNMPHPVKIMCEAEAFSYSTKKDGYLTSVREPDDGGIKTDDPMIIPRREWSLEVIGEESQIAEAEIIQVLWKSCRELGLAHDTIELRINATGCTQCRTSYRSSLGSYFRARAMRLCTRSRRDLKRSPARIFSCADERCRGVAASAPQILDFLCERCKKQLRSLLEFFDEAKIPYFLDPTLFRDGSWLDQILFVILLRPAAATAEPGSDGAAALPAGPLLLAEGGRLARASELFGGRDTAAACGTLFLDTAAMELARRGDQVGNDSGIFFVQLGELAKRRSFEILESLREGGIEVRESLGRDSIRIQLKIAERVGAKYAVVLGQKEALDGTVIVREVESGIQETMPQERLVDFLKKKIKR